MAEAINFPEADRVEDFSPPAPSRPLPVKQFPKSTVSCWKLTGEEKAMVAQTGLVWLTTRTFKRLDDAPDGERWQPDVLITADKHQALMGWGDNISTAPAADRIVRFSDNEAGFDDARNAISQLAAQLKTGNDLGDMSVEEIDQAKFEVHILEMTLACDACRVDWVNNAAKHTLKWIVKKAGDVLVADLATKSLAAIMRLITNSPS